jgi:pyridoxal phosphate enzyme (YggS family)
MTESPGAAMDRRTELANAFAALGVRITRAAEKAGRKVHEIELLPITKFFPATDVAILASLGCSAFGESRDQEASAKVAALADELPSGVRWHMVGQIQRNKARSIAVWADVAHSVSTARVAVALDRAVGQARADGQRTDPMAVYVQISLDGDISRGGIDVDDPAAIDELCAQIDAAEELQFVGLMGVPPLGADPETAFARLDLERQRVQGLYQQRLGLSAGMSDDLEAAVKHGSTCLRVGTALMGPRPLTSP